MLKGGMALIVGGLFLLLAFQPMTLDANSMVGTEDGVGDGSVVETAYQDLTVLVEELMRVTSDTNHSDADGMPDSVEWVIGTDPFNDDSDFDGLNDYEEILLSMDPESPDSNNDKFPDYKEVMGVPIDLDGDGQPNAWDWDNDGDGVVDYIDLSPFASTSLISETQVEISYSGDPLFVTFQLRTADPDHMKLLFQTWDWPNDRAGTMKDLDKSTEDITIAPMLKVDSSILPPQEDILEYGMVVEEGSIYVPLFPVWEMGNVVALKARMYVPSLGSPQTLDLTAELIWKVNGKTDVPIASLEWIDGGHLALDPEGKATISYGEVSDNETLEWTELGGGKVAIVGSNGLYLNVDDNGSVDFSSGTIEESTVFTRIYSEGGSVRLTAFNGNDLAADWDGNIRADGNEGEGMDEFIKEDLGFRKHTVTLAYYYEDFILTGLSAEENHGTDVALVYGDDEQNMVAANLIMAYEFLRDPENDIPDIDDILDDHDLIYRMQTAGFATSDEAVRAITTLMMPMARENASGVGLAFYITAFIDRSRCIEMSDVAMATDINGTLVMNLDNVDLVTSRLLKTSWYEDDDEQPLDLHEIVQTMGSWGLTTEELASLTGLMASWCVGEVTVTHVNSVPMEFNFPEGEFISETVDTILSFGLGAIDLLMFQVEIITTAYAFSEAFVAVGNMVKTGLESTWKLFKQAFTSVRNSVQGAGSFMSRVSTTLNVIGIVIAVVISLYALFSIGFEMGWTAVGTGIAVTTAIFTLAYTLILIGIASLGPVGAIIAGLIAIVDVIGLLLFGSTWGQEFLKWLIDVFTDTNIRSEVNLDTIGSDTGLIDLDGNGIDAGDRIWFKSWHYGNVTITSDGSESDVRDSYIIPQQTMSVPWYSWSATGGNYTVLETSQTSNSKSTLYETEAWVQPGIGMVNFPVAVGLRADYNVYYDDCWWFFGWWCDRESYSDSQSKGWTTLYFDVMPGSVDEFALWKSIKSNDRDGDGLKNEEENGTSAWSWDTDQDGLGDEYEIQIGTDPALADSDKDGVNDREEHIWGSDPWSYDSDRDGLTDIMEHSGWVVNFTYQGTMFYWHVRSNPCTMDGDGDGITDLEEYHSLLNPVSDDTDGDGVKDELRGYYQTSLEYSMSFGYGLIEGDWGDTRCLAIDSEGMVYSSGYEDTSVHVYHPNGTLVDVFDTPILGVVKDLAIGPDDNLYICGNREVLVMNRSGGLLLEIDPFLSGDSSLYVLEGIALDESGQIFVSMDDHAYSDTQPGLVRKYQTNGTYVADIIVGNMSIDRWYDYYTKFHIGHDGLLYVINSTLIQVFDQNGVKLREWGGYGNMPGQFADPKDIIVDEDGNVLVTDSYTPYILGNALVQKFTNTGNWMFSFGYEGEYPQLNAARGIALDEDNSIYIGEGDSGYIQKFWHNTTWIGPIPPEVLDSDGDGLNDVSEETGWETTVTTEHGPGSVGETTWVSSDAFSTDTDKDGLPDPQEFDVGSDPRSVDTDRDNLKDAIEIAMGTDPCHWDSDGDGLSDGKEVKFGSDPLHPDPDGDGLNDLAEFDLGSDPRKNDTDQDGLGDLQEALAGSDLMDPDSDDDFMFDGTEFETGTGLNADDSDGDGISDGYESLYETDPLNGDTDDDNLSDGFEVATYLNPLSNDTDGDGLNDSFELETGLNPRSQDSDGDGVPDGLDTDNLLFLDQDVMLVIDSAQFNDTFFNELTSRVNVTVVTAQELIDEHYEAKYIVLVGDPANGAGTAGGLISQLLSDSGNVLDSMTSSPIDRMAVRYGVWNATQTVVMFSMTYDTDAIRAVGVLKSMSMTVSEKGYMVQYHNPRACFKLDLIDSMHLTDTFIWAKLGSMDTFEVGVTKVNATEAPSTIGPSTGIAPGWMDLDKFVNVELSLDDPNTTLEGALVRIYYTDEELDMNGDGDTDDLLDIDEQSIRLWSFSSDDGRWERIGSGLGSNTTGVNTTDQEIFGIRYSGYVWANVTELGWFALAGRPHAIDVRIDIRSSDGNDKMSIKSGGLLRVIIYGNEDADGIWIDVASLRIGNAGVATQKNDRFKFTCKDVDRDGWNDLVVYFSVSDLVQNGELTVSTELLEVNGSLDETHGPLPIRGYGAVVIAPGQTR